MYWTTPTLVEICIGLEISGLAGRVLIQDACH
jgi:coenzyme PQQ precursor peptide PqqA